MYHEMLKTFREDRGLTEYNRDASVMMVNQELQEVLDAKTWNHRIEEMCDVCVLCLNALAQQGLSRRKQDSVNADFVSVRFAVEISEIDINFNHFDNAISNMRDCIVLNGYDFDKAMTETCKKILSRKGAMNQVTGKWEKFKHQNDAYVPDYESCRVRG